MLERGRERGAHPLTVRKKKPVDVTLVGNQPAGRAEAPLGASRPAPSRVCDTLTGAFRFVGLHNVALPPGPQSERVRLPPHEGRGSANTTGVSDGDVGKAGTLFTRRLHHFTPAWVIYAVRNEH